MIRQLSIALAAIGLAGTAALAGPLSGPHGPSGIVVNKESGVVVATSPRMDGAGQIAPTLPPRVTTIAGNLAKKYKKGSYICCYGYDVRGPTSGFGQQWLGVPFTPAANFTITAIEVPISYESGTNKFVITLNHDSGGVPGTQIAAFTVTNVPAFPTCCALATVSPNSVSVTGGQHYWITVQTSSTGQSARGVWNANDTDQTDAQSVAANSGAWGTASLTPGLAFAVFGN
jgi:hypothetical protein